MDHHHRHELQGCGCGAVDLVHTLSPRGSPIPDGRVVVLEYEVYGRVVASDATYENRFVSIVTIENRKVVLWRDYMDSLAAMRALSR